MAKDKNKEKLPPIKSGGRFICRHCRAEVPAKQSCPKCKTEFDWTNI